MVVVKYCAQNRAHHHPGPCPPTSIPSFPNFHQCLYTKLVYHASHVFLVNFPTATATPPRPPSPYLVRGLGIRINHEDLVFNYFLSGKAVQVLVAMNSSAAPTFESPSKHEEYSLINLRSEQLYH